MNLYRSLGHKWTGTQADARAANNGDKNFEHIDVPTDKPGLLAFLNTFDVRLHTGGYANGGVAQPAETPPPLPQPGEFIIPGRPLSDNAPYQNGHPTELVHKSRDPAAKTICVACGRTPQQAEKVTT